MVIDQHLKEQTQFRSCLKLPSALREYDAKVGQPRLKPLKHREQDLIFTFYHPLFRRLSLDLS